MTDPRATVVVTQRERFGMTKESLESLYQYTPNVRVIYVDGKSPTRISAWLQREAGARGFTLIRKERFLNPNEARNIGATAAKTEFVVFVDNDVLFTEGWLDRLIACADETSAWAVAPLTCQGLPAHTEIHHAGGDYAPGGDMEAFFEQDPKMGRAFEEVMHGQAEKLEAWGGRLERKVTGMCEFHCVLVRRDVFNRLGPLDEKLLSTKEHIDFSLSIRQAGGKVWFEPSSIVTYVFPCRARPMTTEDWPFFALRWSDAYGARSLEHFIAKWGLRTKDDYVTSKKRIYAMRRYQGILVPLMRRMPLLGTNERFVRKAASLSRVPEKIVNAAWVAWNDKRASRTP